ALVRQVVLRPRRTLTVEAAFDQTLLLEPLQSLREQVGGDLLWRAEKLAVARLAGQQVAHDQQRPAIADQVQGAGHRAVGAPLSARFGLVCSVVHSSAPPGYLHSTSDEAAYASLWRSPRSSG